MKLARSLALVAACSSPGSAPHAARPAPPPLYDRLGGMDALTEIAGRAVAIVAADRRLARFKITDAAALRDSLARQLCELGDGPCKYTGRDMRTAHAGMAIHDADFDAWLADFATALDDHHVRAPDKAELLRRLAAHRPQIVAP